MGRLLNFIKLWVVCLLAFGAVAPVSVVGKNIPVKSANFTNQNAKADGDTDFLEGFQDVPLLNGFTVLPSHQIIYDTAAGTIVQTVIEGGMTQTAALEIYKKSLPALGWQCQMKEKALSCDKADVTLMIRPHKISTKRQGLFLVSMPKKPAK